MTQRIILFLVFNASFHFGQKIKIIHESGYKHNYLVGPLKYLEDKRDTSRAQYIFTLQLSDSKTYYQTIVSWFELLQIKARELGANTYIVSSFEEDDQSMVLQVKFYFAPKTLVDLNKKKSISDSIFAFNQIRDVRDTACFYLNDKRILFDPLSYYAFETKLNTPYYLAVGSSNITTKKLLLKKSMKARFFIIPTNKSSFVVNRNALDPNKLGVSIYGAVVTFGRNSAYELDYDIGRLLVAAYSVNGSKKLDEKK